MTGNGAGWDAVGFSRGPGQAAGTTSAIPWAAPRPLTFN
jgi:hypothetical protein